MTDKINSELPKEVIETDGMWHQLICRAKDCIHNDKNPKKPICRFAMGLEFESGGKCLHYTTVSEPTDSGDTGPVVGSKEWEDKTMNEYIKTRHI